MPKPDSVKMVYHFTVQKNHFIIKIKCLLKPATHTIDFTEFGGKVDQHQFCYAGLSVL